MRSVIAGRGAARLASLATSPSAVFSCWAMAASWCRAATAISPRRSGPPPHSAFACCCACRGRAPTTWPCWRRSWRRGLLANWLGGAAPPLVIGFSVINLLDVLAGLVAMRNLAQPRFNTLKSALRFALAAAISPSLFGAILSYLPGAGDGR